MNGRETRNILLAEASSVSRMLIKAILQHAGHRVVAVPALDLRIRSVHAHYGASGAYDTLIVGSSPGGEHPAIILEGMQSLSPPHPPVPVVCLAPSRNSGEKPDLSMFDGVIERPINPHQCLAVIDALSMETQGANEIAMTARPAVTGAQTVPNPQTAANQTEAGLASAGQVSDTPGYMQAEASTNRSRQEDGCLFDELAMQDLINLGGREFAAEIVDQFVTDGMRLLKDISAAVDASDGISFREHAHALRSCAANVGARGIYDLCMQWREANSSQLAAGGADYSRNLEREFLAMAALLRSRYGADSDDGDGRVAASA